MATIITLTANVQHREHLYLCVSKRYSGTRSLVKHKNINIKKIRFNFDFQQNLRGQTKMQMDPTE